MLTSFIEEIKTLSNLEDLLVRKKELINLKTNFEKFILDQESLNNDISSDQEFVKQKKTFISLFNDQIKINLEGFAQQNNDELKNLDEKLKLIEKFKTLISKEENIGFAFSEQKKINEEWKQIGEVPIAKRQKIQRAYSRLMEDFYYNMKIYREIKSYDLKKNFELKTELIKELKELLNSEKIKEIEFSLKSIQNRWEDIGPTSQELWNSLRDEYWSNIKSCYQKIQDHYNSRRNQIKERNTLKSKLVSDARNILNLERDSIKSWNEQAKNIIQLQNNWKKIGFSDKIEGERLWIEFKQICNDFFESKKRFHSELDKDFKSLNDSKCHLIEQVEKIKESTDWEKTTELIINYQKEWRKIENIGHLDEQKLWKKFNRSCNYFFDCKKAYLSELEMAKKDVLEVKKSFLENLKSLKLTNNWKDDFSKLKNLALEYSQIGDVPLKYANDLFSEYEGIMNHFLDQVLFQSDQKEDLLFESKLFVIKGSNESKQLFHKLKKELQIKINKVEQEKRLLENNLGFFVNSKSNDFLKLNVEKNIEAETQKLEKLRSKLKMIPIE